MEQAAAAPPNVLPAPASAMEVAFGYPRDFLANRYVYVVFSPRARGLAIGVNLTPSRTCNFDCVYCEVQRRHPVAGGDLDINRLATELDRTLSFVRSGRVRELPACAALPPDLLQAKHVALSGDGEPTLCPKFAEVVETVVHVRALSAQPLKMVLVTNATGLDLPPVQRALKFFTRTDEVWAKLDAGTPEAMQRINRNQVPMEKILTNIKSLGRTRPVVIQSMFLAYNGAEPTEPDLMAYCERLKEIQEAGARVALVQVYSAVRPMANSGCTHLPLRTLSRIAQMIRKSTGLQVEVF